MNQVPAGHRLCDIDALADGDSAAFEVGTLSLMLIRHRGRFYAYANRCPHTGAPLDWVPGRFLDLQRRWIQCATHDALFRIDTGECVYGPCPGQALQALPLHLGQGAVWLSASSGNTPSRPPADRRTPGSGD